MEQYVNDFGTTLAGGIDPVQTTLSVANGAGFPSSGTFRIRIDGELMIVTGVSGTTWTVTRGAEGTVASSHLNGSAINCFLTAGALDAIRADIHTSGLQSARPTAPKSGDCYFGTDSGMHQRYNGSSWEMWSFSYPFTVPVLSDFSQSTLTNTTVTDTGAGIVFTPTANNNGGLWLATSTVTAPYTCTMGMSMMTAHENYAAFGLYLRDSVSDLRINFIIQHNGSQQWTFQKYNAGGAYNANYTQFSISETGYPGPITWFRVVDDGSSTRSYQISCNGFDFMPIYSTGRTDWCTPNQMGFQIGSSTNYSVSGRLLHWSVTQP